MFRMIKTSAVGIGLASFALLLAAGLAGAGDPIARAQGGAPPPCGVDKVAAPAVVPLGYSTRVTLTVHTSCVLSDTVATHIVLVVDTSGSMAGAKMSELRKALDRFVVALDLPGHLETQVAVVKYSTGATTLCALTKDEAKLHNCIRKLEAGGATDIDVGIRMGLRELIAGRGHGGIGAYREVMILTTDGQNNTGCPPVLQAASQAKSMGVALAPVTLGADSDVACMAAAATPGFVRVAPLPTDINPVFQELARFAATPFITRLTVLDSLPPNMRLEPGTVKPAPFGSDAAGLVWEWWHAPAGDHVITYAVTPLELGDHPVNVAAEANLVAPGRADRWVFPVPRVRVVDGTGRSTPTPFATATPGTPTPLPTWYPTPVPSPLPPATRVPGVPYECPGLARLAPAQAIADALANPARVGGWGQPCNPSLPPGPQNPSRTTLGLQTAGKPYHPVFNGLVFKCGCP